MTLCVDLLQKLLVMMYYYMYMYVDLLHNYYDIISCILICRCLVGRYCQLTQL